MNGYTKCPEWLKLAYRKAVKFTCEGCNHHEDKLREGAPIGKLIPHRIIRGNKGGTYRPGNVKMLCGKCHKAYHGGEFL